MRKNLSKLSIVFGAILTFYGSFIYDPTVSTSDFSNCDGLVDDFANGRTDKWDCAKRQFDRSMRNERIVNIYRMRNQDRMFYGGIALFFAGCVGLWLERSK